MLFWWTAETTVQVDGATVGVVFRHDPARAGLVVTVNVMAGNTFMAHDAAYFIADAARLDARGRQVNQVDVPDALLSELVQRTRGEIDRAGRIEAERYRAQQAEREARRERERPMYFYNPGWASLEPRNPILRMPAVNLPIDDTWDAYEAVEAPRRRKPKPKAQPEPTLVHKGRRIDLEDE